MNPVLYNDWWSSTDQNIGPYNITSSYPIPSNEQLHNAYKLKRFFESWPTPWSLSAICGTIGNFMHETTINPARVQATHVGTDWPYPIATFEDVPNSRMIDFYGSGGGYALGLAQWDGKNDATTVPHGQKLVSYAIRNNMNWYDGNLQCMRLKTEYDNDLQFLHREVFGVVWTWQTYIVNTRTPEQSADIWRDCYERPDAGFPESERNARWWYDYFTLNPYPPFDKPWLLFAMKQRKKAEKNVKRII